ncbi:MAG TPA: polysaccharide biosynthesis/export family protein [Pyrinomonadaceae bacterium]|nr:polysaccharide biosynthesis/export family protein [Pyrinomonadaceae bacterium]
MKKFFYSAAVALALSCAPSARAAHFQTGAVRVGPAADEAAAPQPSGEEKKTGTDAKKQTPASDAQAAAEQPHAAEAGANNRGDSKPKKNSKSGKSSQLPNSTANALAPAVKSDPSATSDAPPKTGPDKTVPVGAPVKTASGAESAPESNKPDSNRSDSNKSDANKSDSNKPATTPASSTPNSTPAGGDPNASEPVDPKTYGLPARPTPAPAAPPVSPADVYRIGTGDVLDIRLLNGQDPRQSTLYPILAGGVLDYPLLRDPLTVAGMTTEELAAQLIAELRHRSIQQHPQVRVSVREYASHAVLVSGLVNDPGTKIIQREAIPLYVLIAGAQAKPEAGRAVIVSRASGKVINVDLNDAAGLNTLVQSGDVVTLTVRPPEFFYVGGEIAAPGQKDFHTGLTLTQALLASGGVTRLAGDRVRVARQGADGRLVSTEYNMTQIEAGQVPDPALQPGDRIEVSRRK